MNLMKSIICFILISLIIFSSGCINSRESTGGDEEGTSDDDLEINELAFFKIDITTLNQSDYEVITPVPVISGLPSGRYEECNVTGGEPIRLLNELEFTIGSGSYNIIDRGKDTIESYQVGRYGLGIKSNQTIRLEVKSNLTSDINSPSYLYSNFFNKLSSYGSDYDHIFLKGNSTVVINYQALFSTMRQEWNYTLSNRTIVSGWNSVDFNLTGYFDESGWHTPNNDNEEKVEPYWLYASVGVVIIAAVTIAVYWVKKRK